MAGMYPKNPKLPNEWSLSVLSCSANALGLRELRVGQRGHRMGLADG